MTKKMHLSYYAIFDFDENGIDVLFPDHPSCFSCGLTMEEAKKMASEALELHLHGTPINEIPLSTDISLIKTSQDQRIVKINVEFEIQHGKLFSSSVIEF